MAQTRKRTLSQAQSVTDAVQSSLSSTSSLTQRNATVAVVDEEKHDLEVILVVSLLRDHCLLLRAQSVRSFQEKIQLPKSLLIGVFWEKLFLLA